MTHDLIATDDGSTIVSYTRNKAGQVIAAHVSRLKQQRRKRITLTKRTQPAQTARAKLDALFA